MSSIDVVIPNGRFLRHGVGIALRQNVDALRVLIIDNASTDGSLDLARRLASEDKGAAARVATRCGLQRRP